MGNPISFADAQGNLFNRLGKLGAILKNAYSNQQTQLTAFTNTSTGAVAQYNDEPDIQALIGSSYIGTLNSIGSTVGGALQSIAQETINRAVYRSNPQLNQTLTSDNTLASIAEVIRQMYLAGATVLQPTIGASFGSITGIGNGAWVVSTVRPQDGRTLENSFAETITFTCVTDSYTNTATAGNETFDFTGAGVFQPSGVFNFDWPNGSGADSSLTAIDGASDNSSNNLLTNSSFESWASGLPSNYTFASGSTLVSQSNVAYDGSYALALTGDGSSTAQWTQLFNSTTGTSGTLSSETQYSFCMWLRRDGIAPASGVITVDLVDGNSNVIQDVNGTNNSFTIDLTQLTTVYTPYTGVFRTPTIMPSTYSIRYRLSTALTSGRVVYLDKAGLGEMTQSYTSGPYFSYHAGSTPAAIGDYVFATITNSRGSGGTLSTFQTLWAQLFPQMIQYGYLLPSSPTPTISDSLIG